MDRAYYLLIATFSRTVARQIKKSTLEQRWTFGESKSKLLSDSECPTLLMSCHCNNLWQDLNVLEI